MLRNTIIPWFASFCLGFTVFWSTPLTCWAKTTSGHPVETSAHGGSPLKVEIVGTLLRITTPAGQTFEGAQLDGVVLTTAFGTEVVKVRIASVIRDDQARGIEVFLYDFRRQLANGTEEPLCLPDPDGRRLGFPLAIQSDGTGAAHLARDGAMEVVCTSGAQGKCVRFGYAPWGTTGDGHSLLPHYNACVRMLRADYCGDGRSFTRDGTPIDIWDKAGIQVSDSGPDYRFEAVWGPKGAECVAKTRIADVIDVEALKKACPRLRNKMGAQKCSQNAPGLVYNRSR